VPRPVRRPVECFQPIVSANPRGLDFMARHGIKGIIGGGAAAGGAAERTGERAEEALARHGRETELGGDLIVGVSFYIADSEEQAIREATPFFEENLKMFAPLGFVRGLSDEQIARVGEGPDAPGWSERDAALLRAADELHDDHRISDETWRVLADRYDVGQLVEILYVVGQYAMLSMVANVIDADHT